jgi:hypothetical protein
LENIKEAVALYFKDTVSEKNWELAAEASGSVR